MSGRVTLRIDRLVIDAGLDPRSHARAIESALVRALAATPSGLTSRSLSDVQVSARCTAADAVGVAVAAAVTGRPG